MSIQNPPLADSSQPMLFPEFTNKVVTANFDGGLISSDGGGVLLGRVDRSYGFIRRFATCFDDYRDEELVEHLLEELLRQRVYGLALGYEDLNDHDQLRGDPLLASLCGKEDPVGQNRVRKQDKGRALAGKSTLNRMELTADDANAAARYKKIVARFPAIEDYFIDEWVRGLSKDTREVVLDLDRTNDALHGNQEGRHYHGYYDQYCYTPLHIFCGKWPVAAALHTCESEHQEEILRLVGKIIERVRQRLPQVQIILRGDSGFCRDNLMSLCEGLQVRYAFGLARNRVLERLLRGSLRAAKGMLDFNGSSSERLFKDFGYRAKDWAPHKRRVVGKAEWTTGGPNPRFVVTNLSAEQWSAQSLYEGFYCPRGEMENRIKEQKLDLFSDRTSTGTLRANQLRLWFSTMAYVLVEKLRQVGLAGTEFSEATCGTIRLRLFKIGAVVRVSVRRVWVSLSSAFPLQELFALVATRLAPRLTG